MESRPTATNGRDRQLDCSQTATVAAKDRTPTKENAVKPYVSHLSTQSVDELRQTPRLERTTDPLVRGTSQARSETGRRAESAQEATC